eukprot:9468147-Prorocentrum_lima.AAC.1
METGAWNRMLAGGCVWWSRVTVAVGGCVSGVEMRRVEVVWSWMTGVHGGVGWMLCVVLEGEADGLHAGARVAAVVRCSKRRGRVCCIAASGGRWSFVLSLKMEHETSPA